MESLGGLRAEGARVDLPHARLLIPLNGIPETGPVPLSIHFQGGTTIAEENFVRSGQKGVLIASTLSGFSRAFAEPYRDPRAFRELLDRAASAVGGHADRDGAVAFDPITITFFSAGYGAVREILAVPEHYAAIDHLVAADSIYASVVGSGIRAPKIEQMIDFVRFAQAAARGEKTFVVTHTRIATDYASTGECAALLFASIGATLQPQNTYTERGVPIAAELHVGNFHGYRHDGNDATAHMDCLYWVPELVRLHVAR